MKAPWRWGRKPDVPVSDTPLGGVAYLFHPRDGVLEVRRGLTSTGATVFATKDAPVRWFMVFRGTSVPGGVAALILWEVDAGTGQKALERRESGHPDAAPLVDALMDIDILDEPRRHQ